MMPCHVSIPAMPLFTPSHDIGEHLLPNVTEVRQRFLPMPLQAASMLDVYVAAQIFRMGLQISCQ